MYRETFPEKLKQARLNAGYTQKQIQDETGVNQYTLSKYENGEREPNIEVLAKLAQFYNIDANWLLGISILPPIRVPNKRNSQDTERPRL